MDQTLPPPSCGGGEITHFCKITHSTENQYYYPVHCWYGLESGSFGFSFFRPICRIHNDNKISLTELQYTILKYTNEICWNIYTYNKQLIINFIPRMLAVCFIIVFISRFDKRRNHEMDFFKDLLAMRPFANMKRTKNGTGYARCTLWVTRWVTVKSMPILNCSY